MAIEVFNRYEHKYLLNKEQYDGLIAVIEEHMELDGHNKSHEKYTITNIYFDTEDDYLIRKSLSKPEYKEKLRLRSYGLPDTDKKVFLEIKKKYNGIVNKRRTSLSLPDAYNLLESGKMPKDKEFVNLQVVHEIEYFLKVYKVMPKLYLAYDRIAYFGKCIGGNIRYRSSYHYADCTFDGSYDCIYIL